MELELISKKELLEQTDITYGQLYRWKRMRLIPEDWFIKKSAITGHETFFPREKILTRIDHIKNMKSEQSLDDLADVFAPIPPGTSLSTEEVLERGIVSCPTLEFFTEHAGDIAVFTFEKLLSLFIVEKFFSSGDISREEAKTVLQVLSQNLSHCQGRGDLILARKYGVSLCLIAAGQTDVYIENGAKIVARLSLATCVEEIKLKLNGRSFNERTTT